jgi:adenylate cyclase
VNKKKTFWIEFIGDRSVQIGEDETILQASLRSGIPHFHACGGQAKCSTCRVLVKAGASHLTPYTKGEANLRKTIPLPDDVRLACQTYVTGSQVKVHRIIRDELDRILYTTDYTAGNEMGEEKDLALFFLDIRDFTPFMQKYLPFDVIHILRRLFQLFKSAIEEFGGRIIETSGDGLYAVFGFDTDLRKAVQNAIAAGNRIFFKLNCFNEEYMDLHFDHRFQVGIGLHAGKVIVGNIGLGVNDNMTVMGLPVNIASRLQELTKQVNNSFVISREAAELSGAIAKGTDTESALKGIEGSFPVRLIGEAYKKSPL